MARGNTTAAKRPNRALRRSASTASLPTPPRTTHKRKRGRSALSNASGADSDTDDGGQAASSELSSDEDSSAKRRKVASATADDDDADAFWLGDSHAAAAPPELTRQDSADDLPMAVRNFRLRAASSLASPPPSFRQKPSTSTAMASPPCTPPRSTSVKQGPIRDSPSNPFLSTPLASDEEIVFEPASSQAEDLSSWDEKPTITMIYRGSKRVFANPNYDPDIGRARPINPNSFLDPSHPDYEPDFRAKPRVLFPKRKKKKDSDDVGEQRQEKHSKRTVSKAESPEPVPERLTGHTVLPEAGFSEESMDRYFASIASSTPV